MGETLREFIDRRLRELLELEAPLLLQLDTIRRERADLEKTARMIGLDANYPTRSDNLENQANTGSRTIKEEVLKILEAKPNGLAATDILREINASTGMQYLRTSLSPQLSRLKRAGQIKQDGIVWTLINKK